MFSEPLRFPIGLGMATELGVIALEGTVDDRGGYAVALCDEHDAKRRREPWLVAGVLGGLWAALFGLTAHLTDADTALPICGLLGLGMLLAGHNLIRQASVLRVIKDTPSGVAVSVGQPFLDGISAPMPPQPPRPS